MSVEEMCALAQLGRAGYYRFLTTPAVGFGARENFSTSAFQK